MSAKLQPGTYNQQTVERTKGMFPDASSRAKHPTHKNADDRRYEQTHRYATISGLSIQEANHA